MCEATLILTSELKDLLKKRGSTKTFRTKGWSSSPPKVTSDLVELNPVTLSALVDLGQVLGGFELRPFIRGE